MKHGDLVIPLGFNKGKTLDQVDLADTDRLLGWMEQRGLHKSWKYEDFYKAAVEYLELNHYGADGDHGRTS